MVGASVSVCAGALGFWAGSISTSFCGLFGFGGFLGILDLNTGYYGFIDSSIVDDPS